MRNYIILNGTSSNTINGLLIQSLAPISKPLMRTETEEIDGRDGDISIPLGFSAYDKEITIGLYGTYDINQVISFFNSEGTVTFSNEPDKYYNYQIFDQIDFERLIRFKTATVTFHIQPFKFATTGESQTLDSGDPVSDEGTNLVLEGTGEAPFSQFDLKGNTEQDGTPTPSAPQSVKVVTGENVVKICGKNLFDEQLRAGDISNPFANPTIRLCSTQNLYLYPGTYTFSSNIASPMRYALGVNSVSAPPTGTYPTYIYDSGWTVGTGSNTTTFTINQGGYFSVQLSKVNNAELTTSEAQAYRYQLELGSTATAYEPYHGQSYEVNLGKNLLDDSITGSITWQDTTVSFDGDEITINKLSTGAISAGARTNAISCPLYSGQTYTLSLNYKSGTILTTGATADWQFLIYGVKSDGTTTSYLANARPDRTSAAPSVASASFTPTDNLVGYKLGCYIPSAAPNTSGDVIFDCQLELGSATTYAPYFEPIELCKLGDYQDYIYKDGDKWYVHKAVGKVVLDGGENWATALASIWGNNAYLCTDITNLKAWGSTYSNYFVDAGLPQGAIIQSGYMQMAGSGIVIRNDSTTTVANLKTWLGSNNVSIFYALATPTDTEITNEALIEQLDDIYYHAHAYKGRTHIASLAATGNVPHIIAATVNGDASGTITNAGNIYSKPKLTVYGTGDIGIYLNGVQMFQIALGTSGYITIDTNLMEAYQDNLETLMNRQVTGDYSNFKLPVGESTISFSGAVTSCVVENYSRWL